MIHQQVLHPTALPTTPYAALTANYSHRQEHWWQFRVYTTASTFTGARIGLMALPDPNFTNTMNADVVWAACCNGRGIMVDVCGNRTGGARFHVTCSTTRLSNATPSSQDSLLGFASSTLIGWLLQAPIGLQDSAYLSATILGRVCLTCYNPLAGFATLQLPYLRSTPNVAPGTPVAWELLVALNSSSNGGVDTNSGMNASNGYKWALGHIGDAWLAGGWYFQFFGAGQAAPTIGSSPNANNKLVTIKGAPRTACVYTCNHPFQEWETNRGFHMTPKYFATFVSPISQTVTLVGFNDYEAACHQASGNTGMVPANTELCVTYGFEPKWIQFHPNTSQNQLDLQFFEIFSAEGWKVRNIYSTVSNVSNSASGPLVTAAVAASYTPATYTLAGLTQPTLVPAGLSQPTHQQMAGSTPYWNAQGWTTTSVQPCNPSNFVTSSNSSTTWEEDSDQELEQEQPQPPDYTDLQVPPTPVLSGPLDHLSSLELQTQIDLVTTRLSTLQAEQSRRAADGLASPSPLSVTSTGLPNWISLLRRALAVAEPMPNTPETELD